ncbi:MAG: T9SS type A sorting domain-containing protein, partial [Bacteroidota bacterium]
TTLVFEFQSQAGCDSLITVNIMINTVSVPTIEAVDAYQLFPNPTDGSVQVSLQLNKAIRYHLMLYDITGKNCLPNVEEQKLEAGTHQLWIDLEKLPAGTYTLLFRSDEGQMSQRLVKIR